MPDSREASGPGVYISGPFVVDPVKLQLWRDGHLVPVTAKSFQVLVTLLEHRDRVVTKDELLDRVWPDTAVQENNLARQVSTLRRALGQRPDQHDFIVTIPGQGYRFVAPVTQSSDVQLSSAAGRATPQADVPAPVAEPLAPGRPGRYWRPMYVVAAAALVAALAANMWLSASGRRPEAHRDLRRVSYDEAGLPREASWAPDGEWVVYVSNRAGNADLWKQRLGDPDPVRLTTSDASESQPAWSPDGRRIAFRSERDGGGLFVISAAGGPERLVSRFGYEPAWSPDGSRILFKESAVIPDLPAVYIVDLDGKPPRAFRPDVTGRFIGFHAAWHPDGRHVSLWGAIDKAAGKAHFLSVPLEAGDPIRASISTQVRDGLAGLTPGPFVWARSRGYIYFEAGAGDSTNVWRVTVDPATETWVGGPERLTTGAGKDTEVALSSDETRLVFTATSTTTRLWAFPFDAAGARLTGEPHPVSLGNAGEVDFDVRADGATAAYCTVRSGRHELWQRAMPSGEERLLMSSSAWRLMKPVWSPDGTQLVIQRCAMADSAVSLVVLNADGSGERVLTRSGEVEMLAQDWSNDGRHLIGACRFDPADRYSTCLLPVSKHGKDRGPNVRILASDPARNLFNQQFSPDQRWISFLAHDLSHSSTSSIYVMPAAGGPWQPITDGHWFDDKPRWGPDGKVVYFVSNRSGLANVWAVRFDPSTGLPIEAPFPVTAFRSPRFQLTDQTVQMDIAVTPTQLLAPISESRSDIWVLDAVDR